MARRGWHQVLFYATLEDLSPVLERLESRVRFTYVIAGLFDSREPQCYPSFRYIPDLARARFGDCNLEPAYLMVPEGVDLYVREVPQKRGGTMYAIDQLMNRSALLLRAGGAHSADCIIDGSFSATTDAIAAKPFRLFRREVVRRFAKVRGIFLGPQAQQILAAGGRLTSDVHLPAEYDLRP